jgi:alginate O-acetyltransferase complex protein AlgI
MLFPTAAFAAFFAVVYPICWLLRSRARSWKVFVLGASYVFYGFWDWRFVFLIALSTLVNQGAARMLAREGWAYRRPVLIGALVFNLGLLGAFKYYGFFVESLNASLRDLGMPGRLPLIEVLIPVGISFFTFQAISYVVDVYRGTLRPGRLLDFAVYLAFFPHLVAGPIVRASEFLPQLDRPRTLDADDASRAALLIGRGLFKKVVVSGFLSTAIVDPVFGVPEQHSSAEILAAIYGYAVQIYADFSGYTDIAIGVALMLGFVLPENFERPYQAKNLGEFWRRWHMTLSTWLRDYVFFPLGGSKGSPGRVYFNLWLTMFLVGMWHGASWNFILYSNIHALAMVFNRWNRLRKRGAGTAKTRAMWVTGMLLLFGAVYGLSTAVLQLGQPESLGLAGFAVLMFLIVARLPETGTAWNTALHVLLTFHFTVLSRVFFRADDLDTSRKMIAGLLRFDAHGIREGLITPAVWAVLLFGIGYHLLTPKGLVDRETYAVFRRLPGPLIGLLLAALGLAIHLLLSSGPRANIYFQF